MSKYPHQGLAEEDKSLACIWACTQTGEARGKGQSGSSKTRECLINDTGYPHDGRADKNSYPHDGRADKDSYPHDGRVDEDSYPHDRHNQYIMLSL